MINKIADINDVDNLFELNKALGNETTKENMKESIANNNHEIVCIAYIDNVAVGYCVGLIIKSICHKNCRMDIESLFVRDEYRKKGIGKALIEFVEKEAAAKNIKHFHINTGKNNTNARMLYEKLGYTDTGEILLEKEHLP